MNKLVCNMSKLTSIPESTIQKLYDSTVYCMSDEIYNKYSSGESVIEVDTPIGDVVISIDGDEVRYKFIPNQLFESCIIDICANNKNPMIGALEKSMINKIRTAYKDVM